MKNTATSSNFTIRDLREADNIPYALLLEADPSRDRIESYARQNRCRIALNDELCAGIYVMQISEPATSQISRSAEILNISVDSHFQGIGLGKLLIRDAFELAKDSGAKTLVVCTGNSSLSQLAFYQKCGFRIVGVEPDFFTRNYAEKIEENGIWCRDLIRMNMQID